MGSEHRITGVGSGTDVSEEPVSESGVGCSFLRALFAIWPAYINPVRLGLLNRTC